MENVKIRHLITLTYFKPSGKYYAEGKYHIDIDYDTIPTPWDCKKRLYELDHLPGLQPNLKQWLGEGCYVLIDGDIVPHLIAPADLRFKNDQ